MADNLADLIQVEVSRFTAVATLADSLVANAAGLRDGAKKARELLEGARGDSDVAKIADNLAKVFRLHKIIRTSVDKLGDDVEAVQKTRSAMDKSARAKESMAAKIGDLMALQRSQLEVLDNKANLLQGITNTIRNDVKKARELLAKAKNNDPGAAKIADAECANVIRMQKHVHREAGELEDDIESLRKTRNALGHSPKGVLPYAP